MIDPSGFAQPMEAYSILIPKGWKSQGGITWQVGHPCMTEVIRNRVTATSPDGRFELNIYPAQQWDWWDDQMMLQAMYQNAQNPLTRRCAIAQPMEAGQFLQGPLSDAMTHAGQLAMLRRLAGEPVPSENFIFAKVSADNVGPDQPEPAAPDAWWRADQPPQPPGPPKKE